MSAMLLTGNSSVTGLYVGEIRLLPFRYNELPAGWYFCNGERFLFTSIQGEVLSSLSENFRADWGLEEDMCSISLPNLFHEDGRGCFVRPVDGVERQVGVVQEDAIRNITGGATNIPEDNGIAYGYYSEFGKMSGAFKLGEKCPCSYAGTPYELHGLAFDASLSVPTAEENRPLNIGMTPAIYLGV